MQRAILILNGPNLHLTGTREPEMYGRISFDTFIPALQDRLSDQKVLYRQSNAEHQLIDWLHEATFDDTLGIVINPGALSHTSYAVADAIQAAVVPVIEVHISNIHAREPWRRTSVTASVSRGMICGLGLEGYYLACLALISMKAED